MKSEIRGAWSERLSGMNVAGRWPSAPVGVWEGAAGGQVCVRLEETSRTVFSPVWTVFPLFLPTHRNEGSRGAGSFLLSCPIVEAQRPEAALTGPSSE